MHKPGDPQPPLRTCEQVVDAFFDQASAAVASEHLGAYDPLVGAAHYKPVQQYVPKSRAFKIAGGVLAVTLAVGAGGGLLTLDRHYVGVQARYYTKYEEAELENQIATEDVNDSMDMVSVTDTVNPKDVPAYTHVQVPFSFGTLVSLQKHVADFGQGRSTKLVAQRLKDGTLKLSPVERRFVQFAVTTNRQELAALPDETERLLQTASAADKAADAATAHVVPLGRKSYVEHGATQNAAKLAGRSMRYLAQRPN